jgi:hypothetical protein
LRASADILLAIQDVLNTIVRQVRHVGTLGTF